MLNKQLWRNNEISYQFCIITPLGGAVWFFCAVSALFFPVARQLAAAALRIGNVDHSGARRAGISDIRQHGTFLYSVPEEDGGRGGQSGKTARGL